MFLDNHRGIPFSTSFSPGTAAPRKRGADLKPPPAALRVLQRSEELFKAMSSAMFCQKNHAKNKNIWKWGNDIGEYYENDDDISDLS